MSDDGLDVGPPLRSLCSPRNWPWGIHDPAAPGVHRRLSSLRKVLRPFARKRDETTGNEFRGVRYARDRFR